MRDEMKALDDLQMGDLWSQARTRTPHPDHEPERPRSRAGTFVLSVAVLALMVAIVVALVPLGEDRGPSEEPTPPPTGTIEYRDDLGWTIDVPASWQARPFLIDGTRAGTEFFSGTPQLAEGNENGYVAEGDVSLAVFEHPRDLPQQADDSTFPLRPDDLFQDANQQEGGGWQLAFRGDGVPFILAANGTPSDEQRRVLDEMISSIRFAAWTQGETRNGFVALLEAKTMRDGVPELVELEDGSQWAVSVADPATSDIRIVLLPATACEDRSHGATDWMMEMGTLHVRCGDGIEASYGGDGTPVAGNPETWNDPLEGHAATISWDGWVLAPTAGT